MLFRSASWPVLSLATGFPACTTDAISAFATRSFASRVELRASPSAQGALSLYLGMVTAATGSMDPAFAHMAVASHMEAARHAALPLPLRESIRRFATDDGDRAHGVAQAHRVLVDHGDVVGFGGEIGGDR